MTAISKSAKTHPAAKNVVAGKNLPYVPLTPLERSLLGTIGPLTNLHTRWIWWRVN